MERQAQGSPQQMVRNIDPEEFGMVFERHADGIYNLCFRSTADWSLAQDLTSTVFLEAWRKRGKVDLTVDNARPWLYGTALNVIRNQWRSKRRHRAAVERLPKGIDSPDFGDESDQRLDDEQRMKEILVALKELPKWQRDALVLCDWCDLSYEEAASVLGVKTGTVRSRLSRARHEVRDLMGLMPQESAIGESHE